MSVEEAKKVFTRLPHGLSSDELRRKAQQLQSVVVLRTMWYPELMDGLETSARALFSELEVPDSAVRTVGVPGSLELPLATKRAFSEGADLVIALGCVIRGETPHFDFVCHSTVQALVQISVEQEKPVGMGVLTVENKEQALKRLDKGYEAAQAAVCMWKKVGTQ